MVFNVKAMQSRIYFTILIHLLFTNISDSSYTYKRADKQNVYLYNTSIIIFVEWQYKKDTDFW